MSIQQTKFKEIADAIRAKTGSSALIKPSEFASKISSINGDTQLKSLIEGTITECIIPEGTTVLRSYAFYNCRSLTSITIPNSVTSIGNNAFSYCSILTSVTIGNRVTSIGTQALTCGSLTNKTTFTFTRTTPPTIQSNTFNASYINKIIVPAGCGDAYKAATNWSSFADYIKEAAE